MLRATKFDMLVSYLKGLLPINSHDPWSHGLARSCDILNHYITTNTVSRPPNLAGW